MAGRGTSYTQEFKNSAIQLSLNSEIPSFARKNLIREIEYQYFESWKNKIIS